MEEDFYTHPTTQLPAQLSTLAPEVDWVYDFIFYTSLPFFFGIVGVLLWFMYRYRRRPGVKAQPTGHHNALELFWTFAPLPLLVLMFHWGFQTYIAGAVAPDDAYNVRVRARQWAWTFEHPNGVSEDNELHVPAGRPVRLIMSSSDVLHSFFVPDFRVKRDLVPGMFTSIWFEARSLPTGHDRAEGEPDAEHPDGRRIWYRAQVFCAEYCGATRPPDQMPEGVAPPDPWAQHAGHATMYAQIIVQHPADFDAWLANPPPPRCGDHECSPPEWGEMLFSANQKGCANCHNQAAGPDAPHGTGPNFAHMFGRQEHLASGETIAIDEEYIRHSVRHPSDQVVDGFQPVMPLVPMSDQQLDAIIAYLRTL